MKKSVTKKIMALLLALCMTLGMAMPMYAENGPSSGKMSAAWLQLYSSITDDKGHTVESYVLYSDGGKADVAEGAVYDKSTNTLTLTNFNRPEFILNANEMGDDLKLKLVGENHLQNIIVYGAGWGGNLEITGDGSLTVNENKKALIALDMAAESTQGLLKVGPKATLTAYKGTASGETDQGEPYSARFYLSTSSKVPFEGNLETELTLTDNSGVEGEAYKYDNVLLEMRFGANTWPVYTKSDDTRKYNIYYDYMSGTDENGELYTTPTAYVYELVKVEGLPSGNEYLRVEIARVEGASEEKPLEEYTKTDEVISARRADLSFVAVLEKDGETYYWGSDMNKSGYLVYKEAADNVTTIDWRDEKVTTKVIVPLGGEENRGETREDIPEGYSQVIFKTGTYDYFCTNDVIKVVPKPVELKDEWIKSGDRWWYRHADGSYTKNGWEKINGKWYLFDGSGWMLTGWQKVGTTWYLLDKSGSMLTGWQQVGSKWYYMYDSGAMATNTWIGSSYVDQSGAWVVGKTKEEGKWMKSGNRWWYRHADGSYTKNGWEKINDKWYLFDGSGWMLTGWQQVGSKWYYMYDSGAMAADTWIGSYYVDKSGVWVVGR